MSAAVSVCIATYRRPERLAALLADLQRQRLAPAQIVVVDNDAQASAQAVVAVARGRPVPDYALQPIKNISLTRNRSVALARHEWLAFVDDDERAPPDWLATLVEAAQRHAADVVLGPVVPRLPARTPRWIARGRFYDWPRLSSGAVVPPHRLRFGNLLMRADLLANLAEPFDPAYGLTGGEDGDLLARLAQAGARIVWCDEAVVEEPVEPQRLTLGWLLRRALRGGQDYARHSIAGRYGRPGIARRLLLFGRAGAQALLALLLAALLLPFGRHHAAHWLTKLAANLGKISVLGGFHYREYA